MPAPLGPTTATNSPGDAVKVKSGERHATTEPRLTSRLLASWRHSPRVRRTSHRKNGAPSSAVKTPSRRSLYGDTRRRPISATRTSAAPPRGSETEAVPGFVRQAAEEDAERSARRSRSRRNRRRRPNRQRSPGDDLMAQARCVDAEIPGHVIAEASASRSRPVVSSRQGRPAIRGAAIHTCMMLRSVSEPISQNIISEAANGFGDEIERERGQRGCEGGDRNASEDQRLVRAAYRREPGWRWSRWRRRSVRQRESQSEGRREPGMNGSHGAERRAARNTQQARLGKRIAQIALQGRAAETQRPPTSNPSSARGRRISIRTRRAASPRRPADATGPIARDAANPRKANTIVINRAREIMAPGPRCLEPRPRRRNASWRRGSRRRRQFLASRTSRAASADAPTAGVGAVRQTLDGADCRRARS